MKKKLLFVLTVCIALAFSCFAIGCDELQERTVTYVAGAETAVGTAPTQSAVRDGSTFTVAENTFTNEGYVFDGWVEEGVTYAAGSTYRVSGSNVTLTASWERVVNIDIALTYNGGEKGFLVQDDAPEGGSYKYGTSATLAATNPYARIGYEFAGWEYDGTVYALGATVTVTEATEVSASWKPEAAPVFATGDILALNSDNETPATRYLEFTSPTRVVHHNMVYDFDLQQSVPTEVGTYDIAITGDEIVFTQVLEGEGEPATYTGSYYDGIILIRIPGGSGWDMDHIFYDKNEIDTVAWLDFNYGQLTDLDGAQFVAYTNNVVSYGDWSGVEYGRLFDYTDGIFTFSVPATGITKGSSIKLLDGRNILVYASGFAGEYTVGEGDSAYSITVDDFYTVTIPGEPEPIVAPYTVIANNLIRASIDEEYQYIYLNEDGTATYTEMTTYVKIDTGVPSYFITDGITMVETTIDTQMGAINATVYRSIGTSGDIFYYVNHSEWSASGDKFVAIMLMEEDSVAVVSTLAPSVTNTVYYPLGTQFLIGEGDSQKKLVINYVEEATGKINASYGLASSSNLPSGTLYALTEDLVAIEFASAVFYVDLYESAEILTGNTYTFDKATGEPATTLHSSLTVLANGDLVGYSASGGYVLYRRNVKDGNWKYEDRWGSVYTAVLNDDTITISWQNYTNTYTQVVPV